MRNDNSDKTHKNEALIMITAQRWRELFDNSYDQALPYIISPSSTGARKPRPEQKETPNARC